MGGVGGLKRIFGDRFTTTMEGITKVPWTWATASIIAERIVEANPERAKLVGNTFKSMVAYDTYISQLVTKKEAQTMDLLNSQRRWMCIHSNQQYMRFGMICTSSTT